MRVSMVSGCAATIRSGTSKALPCPWGCNGVRENTPCQARYGTNRNVVECSTIHSLPSAPLARELKENNFLQHYCLNKTAAFL